MSPRTPRFSIFLVPDAGDPQRTVDRAVSAVGRHLRRLPDEYGFDTFVFWNEGDEDDQVRRFAEDVVPAARET